MEKNIIESIIKEYKREITLYNHFTYSVQKLISDLISEKQIKTHSIVPRVKDEESLKKKINQPDASYSKLSDLTDIAGVRIITYYENEVDIIARLIEAEFAIDWNNSVDKRKLLEPDRFGYVSLHYVVSFLEKRLQLAEYKRFAGLKVEIQVRSILQHAWAEIEHDLGYKTEVSVPKSIKRRFFRLAGLLELADAEFIQIRAILEEYKGTLARKIETEPQAVSIDKDSLLAFVVNNSLVKNFDYNIATLMNAQLIVSPTAIDFRVAGLHSLEILTIRDLEAELRKFNTLIFPFAKKWIGDTKYKTTNRGISLLYLCYVILGANGSPTKALNFLNLHSIGIDYKRNTIADRIIALYKEINP